MKIIASNLSWKVLLRLSVIILVALLFLNFYNLYTNKFYFFKIDNYIFPILTIAHFVYLYVISFKIREDEHPDPTMRNLEYSLYAIFLVYSYKLSSIIGILSSKADFINYEIPTTFTPVGIVMIALFVFLLILTVLTFIYRKEKIGAYVFEEYQL